MMRTKNTWALGTMILICVTVICVTHHLINPRQLPLDSLTKNIDVVTSMSEKDHVAREGLKQINDTSQLIELSASRSLTDSQKVLLVVAYSQGVDALKSRVIQISKEEGKVGEFASRMLRARRGLATSP